MDGLVLLRQARDAGLRVQASGNNLLIRGPKRAEAMVKLLTEHKASVLAALSPNAVEARRWQEQYTARTFEWACRKRNWQAARRLAWGYLQNEWHRANGRGWPAWQCAGCGSPIGGLEALNLPDGNRVHLEPISCLITFGNRWRAEADAALGALGLDMPVESDGRLSRREADAQAFEACKIELLNRKPAPPQIHPATQPTTHRSPALVQPKIGRPPMRDRNLNIGIVMGKLAKEIGENFSRNHRPMLLNFGRYKSRWLEDFTVVDFVSLLGALRDEGLEYLATTPDALLIEASDLQEANNRAAVDELYEIYFDARKAAVEKIISIIDPLERNIAHEVIRRTFASLLEWEDRRREWFQPTCMFCGEDDGYSPDDPWVPIQADGSGVDGCHLSCFRDFDAAQAEKFAAEIAAKGGQGSKP
jgi:hypothetical protein